jgi:hypothetical protein
MDLPPLVSDGEQEQAADVLRCYYGLGRHSGHRFGGSWFDVWDSASTRQSDLDRFTADDLVAVSFLSVNVPAQAAVQLLEARREEFSDLLRAVGKDRDLVEETEPWADDWAGWRLWNELVALPDVGPTTASKLYARKRPRLRPIYDSVVERVIGTRSIWEPLRLALQADPSLHSRLLDIRAEAGAPTEVSAIRVFDVLTWMHGKGYAPCRWS